MRIIQLVPALHHGDAIGHDTLAIQDFFKSAGHDSRIFSLQADQELAHESMHANEFENLASEDALLIYHYAIPSVLSAIYKAKKCRKILIYHNITPPKYLRSYPHLQRLSRIAREEFASLAESTDWAVADSEYNRIELEQTGYARTSVIPIFLDFQQYNLTSNPVLMKMFDDDFINFIFVGRLTPNKCQHDLIRFYGYFKRFVKERSRLFIVGKWDGFERYFWQLMKLGAKLKLGDLYLTGRVTACELATYYRLSHVFVSMSEHEGFGVPLIESMHFQMPIMAYAAAATPYTLGDSGVLFHDKKHLLHLAELASLIAKDQVIRSEIIKRQNQRLNEEFSCSIVGAKWKSLVDDLMG